MQAVLEEREKTDCYLNKANEKIRLARRVKCKSKTVMGIKFKKLQP